MSDPVSKYLDDLLQNKATKTVKLGVEITIKGIYQLILSLIIISTVLMIFSAFISNKKIFPVLYILTFLSTTLGLIFTSLAISNDELWDNSNQKIKALVYGILFYFILVYIILGIILYKKIPIRQISAIKK